MTYRFCAIECDQQVSIGVEKKRQFPEDESITPRWGMAGVGVGRVGVGGYPKSPYHMPRKILLKKIVHILNICLFCFLFLFLIFSYEQLIQYFCQVQFHRPIILDVRHCASTIKVNMSRGTLSPPQRFL